MMTASERTAGGRRGRGWADFAEAFTWLAVVVGLLGLGWCSWTVQGAFGAAVRPVRRPGALPCTGVGVIVILLVLHSSGLVLLGFVVVRPWLPGPLRGLPVFLVGGAIFLRGFGFRG